MDQSNRHARGTGGLSNVSNSQIVDFSDIPAKVRRSAQEH
jgi:hypothetical protein